MFFIEPNQLLVCLFLLGLILIYKKCSLLRVFETIIVGIVCLVPELLPLLNKDQSFICKPPDRFLPTSHWLSSYYHLHPTLQVNRLVPFLTLIFTFSSSISNSSFRNFSSSFRIFEILSLALWALLGLFFAGVAAWT